MKNVFSREILQRLQQKWQQYEHDSSLWDQKTLEWFNAGTTVAVGLPMQATKQDVSCVQSLFGPQVYKSTWFFWAEGGSQKISVFHVK